VGPARPYSCVVSIDDVRSRIDELDEQIVKLPAARQKLVKEVARYKTDEQAVRAPGRRAAMMERRRGLAIRAGVSPEVVRRVYDAMIDAFIDLELQEHGRISEGAAAAGVRPSRDGI
jgi:isochorismate pyruvate lyase